MMDPAIAKLLKKGKSDPVEAVRLLPLSTKDGVCKPFTSAPTMPKSATLARMSGSCVRWAGMEFHGNAPRNHLERPPPHQFRKTA